MPIYEYICQDCDEKYDKFVRSVTAKIELKCPRCGSPQAKKAFSLFSSARAGNLSSGQVSDRAANCSPMG
jgi:putative FmdB family regulatory protein